MITSKREILQFISLGFCGATAGCIGFSNSTYPNARIGRIRVHNYDWKPHEVRIDIWDREADASVFRETVKVDAFNPDTQVTGGENVEGFPAAERAYEFRVELDSTGRTRSVPLKENASCVGVEIQIGDMPPDANEDVEHPPLLMFFQSCSQFDPD